jgi:hypothetical protein
VDAAPEGIHLLVPVIAAQPGDEGTQWSSDLWLLNPASATQRVWLEYRPVDGGGPHRLPVTVDSGQLAPVHDAVRQLFPEAGDGKGSLHLIAPEGVYAGTRTFNSGDAGTYGQAIPALAGGDLIDSGEEGYLLKLRSTDDTRCNIGFSELDGIDATVEVELAEGGASGVIPLASAVYSVAAQQHLQVNRIFQAMGLSAPYPSAMATVRVLSGGRVYAYASNVDDRTGDAELIPAVRAP